MPPQEDLEFQNAFTSAAPAAQTPPTEPAAQPAPTQSPSSQPAPSQPAQQPIPAPAQPATQADLEVLAKSYGYDVPQGASQADILNAIHRQHQQALYAANYWQGQSKQPEQQPTPQPAAEPTEAEQLSAYFKNKWSAPQIEEDWFDLVERDPATGQYVSKVVGGYPIAPPQVVQDVNKYASWYQNKPREFFQNPYQNVYEAIQEPLTKRMEQLVNERLQAVLAEREETQRVQTYEQQHFQALYQHDPQGRILTDVTGQYILTEYGGKLTQAMQHLSNAGINDKTKLLEIAQQIVGQPPQAAPPAAPPAPGQPTNGNPKPKSFIQGAIEQAMHSPSHGGTPPESPSDGVNFSQTELDSMFVTAGRKSGVG